MQFQLIFNFYFIKVSLFDANEYWEPGLYIWNKTGLRPV